MPGYELLLILAPRTETKRILLTVSEIGNFIVNRGGVIRKFRHLGVRHLGNKIRNKGKVISEGRYLLINAECSGITRRDLWPKIIQDDIVMTAEMGKVPLPPIKRMRKHVVRKLTGFQAPQVADPVFDFPSMQENRMLEYNKKREMLDKMTRDNDYDPERARLSFEETIATTEAHDDMDTK